MKIEVGLEKFNNAIYNIEEKDNVSAWMEYYSVYQRPFNKIFETLYMVNMDSIKEMVDNVNLKEFSKQSQTALQMYSIKELEDIIRNCANYYDFQKEFDVYLLVGLSHIDGTALPSERPFLYLGLERLADSAVETLIQHEFNHLVRFNSLEEFNEHKSMTVGQLAIAEGLATLAPLVMDKLELNEKNIKKALFINNEEFEELRNNYLELKEEFEKDFDKFLVPSLLEKHFMYNEGSQYPKSGYYIGVHYIKTLLEAGYDLKELTRNETKDILYKYKQRIEARG